jgi:zinc ribbon protein
MDRYQIFLLAIGAGLAIRIVMHFVDKRRIKDEVESRGGRIISISWNPFGRGWFFEKNERHYSVTYTDRSGATLEADCKTSLFTGVYWADGPKTEEPKPRFIPLHRCSQCGYAIDAEWRACPNCGKSTEFA